MKAIAKIFTFVILITANFAQAQEGVPGAVEVEGTPQPAESAPVKIETTTSPAEAPPAAVQAPPPQVAPPVQVAPAQAAPAQVAPAPVQAAPARVAPAPAKVPAQKPMPAPRAEPSQPRAEAPPARHEGFPTRHIAQILDDIGYPELQVVPRASDRLRMEAKEESTDWFLHHWPIEVSGLATAVVGFQGSSHRRESLSAEDKDDGDTVSTVTTIIGSGWFIGGLVLGAQKPYKTGMRTISKYTEKDDRTALTRERLAEEALERPARMMRVLKHFSVASNFVANSVNLPYLDKEGKVYAGLAALLAFTPYFFEDPTISVHDKHLDYKRKIYAPLKTGSLNYDPETKTVTPMTNLVWMF